MKSALTWIFFLLSAIGYFLFAHEIARTEHLYLFPVFCGLVILAYFLYKRLSAHSWWWLFGFGIAFRLLFLISTPHLSDDFYRFTWDGELSKDGYSAFAFAPGNYAKFVKPHDADKYQSLLDAHSSEFPEGMNSKGYYSIYPTVNQLAFYTASFGNDPNGNNLIILRIWLLIGEIISFFALRALLKSQGKSNLLALYWLHPLIIIELVGNLHFEGLAITFTLLALYFAWKNKWIAVAISTALAIMTKLTPLFILAALYKRFSLKQWLLTSMLTVILTVLLMAAIMNTETFLNFKSSFGLFFAYFSFNSGIYYAMVDLGTLFTYKPVHGTVSLIFPFITMAVFLYLTFVRKQDLYVTLLLLFSVYFLFSPIVHPWYVTILIPLGILSKKVFPIVWSLLIFGSYLAYSDPFAHPYAWIYFEYATVVVLLLMEFRTKPNWAHRASNWLYGTSLSSVK